MQSMQCGGQKEEFCKRSTNEVKGRNSKDWRAVQGVFCSSSLRSFHQSFSGGVSSLANSPVISNHQEGVSAEGLSSSSAFFLIASSELLFSPSSSPSSLSSPSLLSGVAALPSVGFAGCFFLLFCFFLFFFRALGDSARRLTGSLSNPRLLASTNRHYCLFTLCKERRGLHGDPRSISISSSISSSKPSSEYLLSCLSVSSLYRMSTNSPKNKSNGPQRSLELLPRIVRKQIMSQPFTRCLRICLKSQRVCDEHNKSSCSWLHKDQCSRTCRKECLPVCSAL